MTPLSHALGQEGPESAERPGPEVRLLCPLGVGRTSRVWRGVLGAEWTSDGHTLEAGTEVAIKILRADLVGEPDARETLAFEREASRAVHHPSLARTRYLSVNGPTPFLRDGVTGLDPAVLEDVGAARPWLMLDLIPGASLDEMIRRDRGLPEPLVRSIGSSVARAIGALHAAGWVHGDVKPANIRLDAHGRAILVDLGFARRTGAAGAPHGTPGYLAPERSGVGPPRASADLFALGVTLYELLTGEHPAGALDGSAIDARTESRLKALRRGQIKPPSDVTPRVSPLFDALVRVLLQPSPAARPTASEAASILEEGENGEWWRARITFDASVRRDTVAWSGQHGIPLVGRDDELETLAAAWEQAKSNGLSVLLVGEQGSGKSRLIAEFAHRVRHSDPNPPLYLYARCDSVGDSRPGAPLISLLRRWLHLPSPGTPGKRTRELLERTVSPDTARALEQVLRPGSEDAPAVDIAESAALAEWITRLTHDVPTIIFLDDVNFAGKSTLGALARVARELEGSRLLLILGLRSRAEVRHPAELSELRGRLAAHTSRIQLGPLDEPAVLSLVEHIFHHSVPRLRLARTLLNRTQGLPGSIGELLRLARQRGWTRQAPAPGLGLQLLVSPEELPRPESLRKAVGERLGDLAPRERIWLERFAIVGSRIDPALLSQAWPKANVNHREAAIASLVRNGWLVPAGSRYRFAHPVDREETMTRIPERRARRIHAALGQALATDESARLRRPSYRRAFHLRGAGLKEDLLAILPALLDDLKDRGHPYRRATVAGWGLEALDDGPRDPKLMNLRRRLLEELADAADRLGEREEQRAALEELSELDIDLDKDPRAAGRIYLLHARHAVSSGQFGIARGLLRKARQLMERPPGEDATEGELSQQPFDRAEIERLAARIEAEHSEFRQASKYAAAALELAPDPVARAEAHLLQAEIEILDGSVESALRRLSFARRELRAEEGGLRARSTRASISMVTGRAWRLIGRPYRALRAFERAAELAVQAGEGRLEVEVTARRGRLMADIGREHESELILRDALFSARRIEDKRGEALAALFLGILLGENGEEGAGDLIRRATSLAEELGQGRIEAVSSAIEARIAFGKDQVKLALERSAHGWDLVRRHGAELPDRIVIGGTRALTLKLAERDREAERMVKSIRRRIESDNAQLKSGIMQQRHRRWSLSLLERTLDTDGPLYPRVILENWK
ncbi:Serine/threonine-protein kinase PknB [Planctomycetes bacterium Poly30]|uniref:Serine/threonine-protein kinase PknB n=1 Tax=Saltatorellus ferox TaxID=2528018 RepID=A0A518EWZ7_9BACT|nr:Serine/threonine-protein kinase PknB [Planctomycetes bacterium Poly30]